jgi:hypothetical protein
LVNSAAKRSAAELEQIVEVLNSHVKANPGERMEQIKKTLGYDTKDLVLPIKKLLEAGAIRTEGNKRSTTYYSGNGETPETSGRRKRRKK